MGECTRWGVLAAVLCFELYPVLRYLFCSYFWKGVFIICADTFLLSLSASTPEASLTSFLRPGTPFTIFPAFPSSFYCQISAFSTQWVASSPFSLPKFLIFLLWIFMVVLRKFICFSMILLNRVTSLLLFTICREEWAFVRGRLDGKKLQ